MFDIEKEFEQLKQESPLTEREQSILNYGLWKGSGELRFVTSMTEKRDDSGDYPSTKFICSSCKEDVFEDNHFCANCGKMLVGQLLIPKTSCRLCNYTTTGLKQDCFYGRTQNVSCWLEAEPHWKENINPHYFICSNCKKPSDIKTTYCPHCGKKMRVIYE